MLDITKKQILDSFGKGRPYTMANKTLAKLYADELSRELGEKVYIVPGCNLRGVGQSLATFAILDRVRHTLMLELRDAEKVVQRMHEGLTFVIRAITEGESHVDNNT